MSKRLFGTDGIRGVAGRFPLDEATVGRLGAALVAHLVGTGRAGRIVIGHDTRVSSAPLAAALARGALAAGGSVDMAGVLPTPGVAFLTRVDGYDAGVVLSASHNPWYDNGIKIFQAGGAKIADAVEVDLETRLLDGPDTCAPVDGPATNGTSPARLADEYLDWLIGRLEDPGALRGARVVVDCANGAAAAVAPPLLARLGIEAHFLGTEPDGTNINNDCGSLHPHLMAELVRAEHADLGLAFDGDADRCLAADDRGRILDGDFILYLTGLALADQGRLRGRTVVGTVMSNLWLEQRLAAADIRLLRTPVGDKHVLEEIERGGHALGGEQSGHVIFRDHATTGDGLLTALMLLQVWRQSGRRLSELTAGITPCPQVLLNVPVRSKPDLASHPVLGPLLEETTRRLAGRGRVLVRYSGTEPLARVMTEGEDADAIRRAAEELAAALGTHLS